MPLICPTCQRRANAGSSRIRESAATCLVPYLPGLIAAENNCLAGSDPKSGQLVTYKGVEFSITATGEPDMWQWRFEIGGMTTTGKTRTRLVHMAARRVQSRIDAALRVARPAEHSANPQTGREA